VLQVALLQIALVLAAVLDLAVVEPILLFLAKTHLVVPAVLVQILLPMLFLP
jgi:hypothetical protein